MPLHRRDVADDRAAAARAARLSELQAARAPQPARPDSDPVEVPRLLLPLSHDGAHFDMLLGSVYLLPADAAVKRA